MLHIRLPSGLHSSSFSRLLPYYFLRRANPVPSLLLPSVSSEDGSQVTAHFSDGRQGLGSKRTARLSRADLPVPRCHDEVSDRRRTKFENPGLLLANNTYDSTGPARSRPNVCPIWHQPVCSGNGVRDCQSGCDAVVRVPAYLCPLVPFYGAGRTHEESESLRATCSTFPPFFSTRLPVCPMSSPPERPSRPPLKGYKP